MTVICDIARNLDDDRLEAIRAVEKELDTLVVAFSCRSFDREREERLRKTMAALGPILKTEPVPADEALLARIREAEVELGLMLVAVRGEGAADG
jgi:microsomal dipeptidase-like Zn-dependent dipeptidase